MSGMTKAKRLTEMKRLYIQRAWSDIEMAGRLDTRRETVFRDRKELETEYPFIRDSAGRWKIDRARFISEIKVNLHEALTLYLAARKTSRQTRYYHPHAASALEKLAAALRQPMNERLLKTADRLLAQEKEPERIKIQEIIAQGWVEQRKVRIRYQRLGSEDFVNHTISPYLVEPSIWSDSLYVIALSDVTEKLIAFRIDRIQDAVLSGEEFDIPAGFDDQELLKHAWGIWYGDKEPLMVKLRFPPNPKVIRRLKESKWHPLEKVEFTQDDGCIWSAEVAEWREMLPWIRGWGADVEVLEPQGLREELADSAKHLATQYQISQQIQVPGYRLLWAKAERKTNDYHLLLYHMIDVGNVALELWQAGLNSNLRQAITEWLGIKNMEETGRLVAFLASLHDLGKASPAFQDHPYLSPTLRGRIELELRTAGLDFPPRTKGEGHARHEVISTYSLKDEGLFEKGSILPTALIDLNAQMLGGHHGTWPQGFLFSSARLKLADKGNERWIAARQSLFQELVKVFQPPTVTGIQSDTLKDNIMLTLISGIVSVADWIGSAEENFPYEKNVLPLDSYVRHSRQHAQCALKSVDWKNAPVMPQFDFGNVFGFHPTKAQQQITDALSGVQLPTLAIIEAPMGSGKTEAAMAVYAQWAKASRNSGLYVAMPTTATSNQMHTRIADFLAKQFGKDVEPLLVHSQALLRDVPTESESVEDEEGYRASAQSWFLPRKRSLLAPFGVGTVDQALMSVLQTKHFFVRLLGLSHKVVIFDEVHAYDAYMSELFKRLLIWLRQINVSVIVLSATLPDKTRFELVRAYAGNTAIAPANNYPRLTFATSDCRVVAIELTPPDEKMLQFEWLERDEESIIQRLSEELCDGGCAVVICNTVGRAQTLFETLSTRDEKLCYDDNLILFHARFPMAWREELEKKVLKKFGPNDKDKTKPNPDRPPKAIVIATQVVEQSLDLDFDVMISDHAPIDLLLQRAGRLQRHSVNNPRKQSYRLLIAAPEVEDGLPKFENGDTFVYDEYVLLRTWVALNKLSLKQITLPNDLPLLIEQVYGDPEPTDKPTLLAVLATAKDKMTLDEQGLKAKARNRLIVKPSNGELLWGDNAALEEDDPSVHETFQALTRGDRPGINVVCLHRVNGQLLMEPDEPSTVFDLSTKLEKNMIRELARCSISVHHPNPEVERYLLETNDAQIQAILRRWKKVAALRYHRVAIFDSGICHLKGTGYAMKLDKNNKLGLQIKKENP